MLTYEDIEILRDETTLDNTEPVEMPPFEEPEGTGCDESVTLFYYSDHYIAHHLDSMLCTVVYGFLARAPPVDSIF